MEKFKLKGIKPPGTIDLPERGTFDLEKIDDKLAEILYKEGLPFLEPTPEYRQMLYPDQKMIVPSSNPAVNKKKAKPAR